MATETLALFEHLEFDFLEEFDVFAPTARRGRTPDHHPPALFRAFLHCYYKNVYGIRPVTRELQNTVVWLIAVASIDRRRGDARRSTSSPTSNTSSTGLRPPRRAGRLPRPLDFHSSIDSTDVRTMPADQDASKATINRRRVLPRLRLYDRLDRAKIHDCRGFTESQASARGYGDARQRVTRSPSKNRLDAWRQRLRHARLARPPAGRRGRASRSTHATALTDDPKATSSTTVRSPHRRTQRGRSAEAIDARRTYNRRVASNEPTTPSRTAASGNRSRPRPRNSYEHKCSSRCAFVSLLRSPTTNACESGSTVITL